MSVAFEPDRPILTVPHTDLTLPDGRHLRRWQRDDPRLRQLWQPGMLDLDGWSGPKRLIVICSVDQDRLGALLHVSMSYPDRDPPWADIKLIREVFFPAEDVDVMMMLPRASMYVAGVPDPRVGMDSHVFHLQQTPEAWGAAMITGDTLVYLHPDGTSYVALLGEDWWRWPAEAHGWQRRERCPEALADGCSELEPRLATLALRLSGVPTDA